jgi:hypothetical protein
MTPVVSWSCSATAGWSAISKPIGAPPLREEVVRPHETGRERRYPLPSTSNLYLPGGLRQAPGSVAQSPSEARTYGNGDSEMRVLLSTYAAAAWL